MNVEIGTEAPIFLFWEYLFQMFGIFSMQCIEEQKGSPQDKLYIVHIWSLDNKNVRCCINLQGLKGLTDKNRYESEDKASYQAIQKYFVQFGSEKTWPEGSFQF